MNAEHYIFPMLCFVARRLVHRGILPGVKVQTPLIKERGSLFQLRQGPWEHTEAVSVWKSQ